jgi:hypothetical protein
VLSREKDCLPSLCSQRGAIIIIIIITIIIIIIYFISPAIYFIGRGLVWDFNYGRGYWHNLFYIFFLHMECSNCPCIPITIINNIYYSYN